MKLLTTLLAALSPTATVLATTSSDDPVQQQSTAVFLKIASSNATIDGMFLSAYHIGAAQQTLGLFYGPPQPNDTSAIFYWNTTVTDGVAADVGVLYWTMPAAGNLTAWFSLDFAYTSGTNVVGTSVSAGSGAQGVGWDNNDRLFVDGTMVDDSNFVPEDHPVPIYPIGIRLQQWHACWILFAPYYYYALAWVTAEMPHNPTCQPVSVVKVLGHSILIVGWLPFQPDLSTRTG
ncbi:hypothetical protein B0T22DRAFT_448564 [Podospora appendiculata]|uniref:DUF7907 domain-containing protein n=1 Tax=Podospora appendiculata TaxID=314037 RepID=A0AAE0XH63_9PEZI|nr:hypothetical protein B0T22DRAFT_448564 [Podospora appendiculata]